MNKELRKGLRTWIEIDRKAIKHNFSVFKKLIPKSCKILSVVKSNAYGHGLIDFSHEMEKLGTDFIGVDSIVEGLALRREGIKKPILVLGYTLPEMLIEAVENNISVAVSSFETLEEIKKMTLSSSRIRGYRKSELDSRFHGNDRRRLRIHIKVDTGMGRHGFDIKDINKVIEILKTFTPKNQSELISGQANIKVEGLFTHFSSAKDPKDLDYTKGQIEKFDKWAVAFKKTGFEVIKHACATSGTILFLDSHFDMVRIGIGLYGIYPSEEIEKSLGKKLNLKPVMTWKTIVAEVKKLPKGSKIGYDGTEILKRDSVVAICPIGYWHGYARALSNIGYVLVKGEQAKVLGRVCMDIIMIDVTDIKGVKVGDEMTLLGKNSKKTIKIGDIVGPINASSYEFITRINPLIKKFYI